MICPRCNGTGYYGPLHKAEPCDCWGQEPVEEGLEPDWEFEEKRRGEAWVAHMEGER